MAYRFIFVFIFTCLIAACASQNVLTEEERRLQSDADTVVSQVLFEHELDRQASYNVHKDGRVVIQFAESVSENSYTTVVNKLRASNKIPAVWAEQSGKEVCSSP